MSRIESALNRARASKEGSPDIGIVPDGTPEAELFVGPWDVSTEAVPAAAGGVPAVQPAASAVPTGTLRVAPAGNTRFRDDVVEKVVASADGPGAAAVEQYRRLAAKLHQAQIDRRMNAVMIVSAVPSEGKTLTSVNLALTLSRSYKKRVLLVDADLRRPSLHAVCGLQAPRGLMESVLEPADDNELATAYDVAPGLALLPAGRPTTDPMSVLTSPRLQAIMEEARRSFDWVIVDTAPMAALSDAQVLKDFVDGALLVISAGSTPFELADRAVQALGRDRLLGVVLNGVSEDAIGAAYGYADYYGRT